MESSICKEVLVISGVVAVEPYTKLEGNSQITGRNLFQGSIWLV